MKNRRFFTGLEEVFARFLSLFVSLTLFSVYVTAKSTITLDWYGLAGYLGLFWLIYELLGYVFFLAFVFFSKDDVSENNYDMKSSEQIADTLPNQE